MEQANNSPDLQQATSVQEEINRRIADEKALKRLRSERRKHVAAFERLAALFDKSHDVDRQLQLVTDLEAIERAVVKLDQDIIVLVTTLVHALEI